MDITKDWYKSEFVQHETPLSHTSLEKEFQGYIAIAEGRIDEIMAHQDDTSFANPDGKGKLSDNELQNVRYHFVVAVAIISRYCAMYGMEQEKSYNLSDFYIQTMDKCQSIPEITVLHNKMCIDFCKRMHDLKKATVLSKPVVLCLDYIYSHIHTRITVKQLSEYTGLSASYLSKVFCAEIGMPISTYINIQKLEKAKNLLSYSDYSLTDIANYLAFSSQSHFITVFRKHVGMTPHKYRDKYFRNNWDDLLTK